MAARPHARTIVPIGAAKKETISMTSQLTRNTFAAPAESYDRLMGRYLPSLAVAGPCVAGDAAHARRLTAMTRREEPDQDPK